MIQGQYYEINTTEFFRRALVGDKLDEWEELVAKITHINWTNESDLFIWNLHNNGQFTVHSMYLHMINQNTPFSHKLIWKLKIPLKIKIFLWYLQKEVILTKDNLIKRNWKGSQKRCFYNCNKTIKYFFLWLSSCQDSMEDYLYSYWVNPSQLCIPHVRKLAIKFWF